MNIWLVSSSSDEKKARGKRLIDWIAREKSDMPDFGTYKMTSVGRGKNEERVRVSPVNEAAYRQDG